MPPKRRRHRKTLDEEPDDLTSCFTIGPCEDPLGLLNKDPDEEQIEPEPRD